MTLEVTDTITADDDLSPVEVRDHEQRTIAGSIVTYGQAVKIRGRREAFAPGALAAVDPAKVKLLDHHGKPFGRMTTLEERPDGAYAEEPKALRPRLHSAEAWIKEAVVRPFAEFFASWSARQVWTSNTQAAMSLAVRRSPFGPMRLRKITTAHVESWVREMTVGSRVSL